MDLSTGGLFPPALPLEWSRVVLDGALNGKATEGTKREGYGSLAGGAYYRRNAKECASGHRRDSSVASTEFRDTDKNSKICYVGDSSGPAHSASGPCGN